MPAPAEGKPAEDSHSRRRTDEECVLKAIVFDFDGVIANSEPLHYQGFRDVLAEASIALTESDYYARLLGFDDVGVFQAVGRERGAEWTPADIRDLAHAQGGGGGGGAAPRGARTRRLDSLSRRR